MNATEIAVVLGGIAVIAALAWYFFAPRKAVGAQLASRELSGVPGGRRCRSSMPKADPVRELCVSRP
ncbi:MAG: hypothetical protein JWN88_476 [Frankiales bacterium]|nr:hypothetical protein [Frankiales bacterium]